MANSSRPTVAEAYLRALKSRGVDWIFGNAGTDFAPIIEALAAGGDGGTAAPEDFPRAVEILHETVAVAMAHGYWLMTGRPQCAMVHVNVGAANALMGVINASRGKVPLLFASGRTPITEHGRLGSRNIPIHWGQEMFDQGGMLREFVKWDNELRAGEQVVDLVDRALAITQAEPRGPVYLSLPREVLAEPLPDGFVVTPEPAVTVPTPPHPDPAAIARAAEVLAVAEHPLIITSDGGAELFEAVSAFAERFAVPVVQFWRTSPAIATNHPFYAGEVPMPFLAEADAVLVLDTMVPWLPGRMPLRTDATVIQIGPDPLFDGVPVRSFPAALAITSSPAPAVRALAAALEAAGWAEADATTARRADLVPRLAARRAAEVATGAEPGPAPMTPEFLAATLSDVIGPDAVVVNELGVATAPLELTRHDSFFGPPVSAGLGWGGGAALGIKLAAPDRLVVWATGDGSYVFSNPAACHHAAAALGLGLLTVVADNRVWNAVRRSTIALYPEGAAAAGGDAMPLASLAPAPDYPKLVEAYGGYGQHVEDPAQLRAALEKAVEHTRAGHQALVSVHVSYPDAAHN
ncbi:MAG: thiamine pyrophosphate-requiring protein [Acidimicrobiales bacterium]